MNRIDVKAVSAISASKRSVSSFIIMASYAYYILNEDFISDTLFDSLCKDMLDNLYSDDYHNSHLAHLMTEDRLTAGSFYDLTEYDYPNWAKVVTKNLIKGVE